MTHDRTVLAVARVARFAGRQVTCSLPRSLVLQQHDARDLAALAPSVAEAVRVVVSAIGAGRPWGRDAYAADDHEARVTAARQALRAALDAHYPGLTS